MAITKRKNPLSFNITIDGVKLEEVTQFCYRGSLLNRRCQLPGGGGGDKEKTGDVETSIFGHRAELIGGGL